MIEELKDSGYKTISIDEYNDLINENEKLNNIIKNLENYLLDIGVPRDYLQELKDGDKE